MDTTTNTSKPAKPLTKKALAEAERAEAIESLRTIGVDSGTRVYTLVCNRSRSGMSRNVRIFIVTANESRGVSYHGIHEITVLVARALDMRRADDGGIKVGGAGFDAGHHVVYHLSARMFPATERSGYALNHERL